MYRNSTAGAASFYLVLLFACNASLADDCPCGSDTMRPAFKALVPQECHGADFRPACRRHDNCYDTPGADKRACDRQFLEDLKCSCQNSSRPIKCRIVSRLFYTAVKIGGKEAFEKAQGRQ